MLGAQRPRLWCAPYHDLMRLSGSICRYFSTASCASASPAPRSALDAGGVWPAGARGSPRFRAIRWCD